MKDERRARNSTKRQQQVPGRVSRDCVRLRTARSCERVEEEEEEDEEDGEDDVFEAPLLCGSLAKLLAVRVCW